MEAIGHDLRDFQHFVVLGGIDQAAPLGFFQLLVQGQQNPVFQFDMVFEQGVEGGVACLRLGPILF